MDKAKEILGNIFKNKITYIAIAGVLATVFGSDLLTVTDTSVCYIFGE